MHRSTKQILLTCVSILAITAMTRTAHAQVVINDTGTTTEPGLVNTSVNFAADGTYALTKADAGSTITSATTNTDNTGTLNLSNTSGTNTFGSIGASDHAVAALNMTTGGLVNATGNVFVNAITMNGTAELRSVGNVTSTTTTVTSLSNHLFLTGAGTTFAGDVVTTGGGSTGYGLFQVQAAGINFTGQLGSTTIDRLFNISLYNTGITTASNVMNVYQVGYAQDGTLSMTDATGGSNITRVDITNDHTGTLNISNTSGTNTFGSIGASNIRIAALNVGTGGGSGGTTSVTGNTFADAMTITGASKFMSAGNVTTTSTTFTGAGTLEMTGNNKTLAGDVVTAGGGAGGFGTIKVSGTSTTLSGLLGSSSVNRLQDLQIANAGTTTASSLINLANLSYLMDGTLSMTKADGGSNITAVTTATDGTGTLSVSNTSGMNIFGTIGDSTHYLANLNATGNGGMTAVTGDLYATNMAVSSGSDLDMYGAVTASSLTINGSGSVNFYNNATLTTTTFTGSNAGSLAMRTGGTTFASDVATSGCGTIGCGYITSLAAGQTFSGQLGSSAIDRLTGLYVQNTGATTASNTVDLNIVTFWNDGTLALTKATGGSDIMFVTAVTDDTGTLNLSNTSGTNTFGAIGNSTHELKALNLTGSGGTTLVNDDMFVTNTTIGSGSILRVGVTGKTFTGAIANNGTFALGTNTVTVDGNITGTNGTITTTIDVATSGNIINTSNTTNATFLSGLYVTPTVSGGVTVNNRDKFVLLHGNTGLAAIDPSAISTVESSGLLRWSLSSGTAGTDFYGNAFNAQDLVLTASRFVISEISGVNTGVMPVIGNLDSYTGSNAAVLALQSELQNLTTGAELNKAGAQLAPQTNDSDRAATIEVVRTALTTLAVREDTLRAMQAEKKGISSGEALDGAGVWTQGFGSLISEGMREGVNGYDSATGGAAFGADARLLKSLRAGVLIAYANTNIDETGYRTGSGLDINSYIGTLYGTYTGSPWYVDGAVTMGYHDYSSTRLIDALGTTQTAKGDYIGKQYGANVEVGYPMKILRAILTPFASFAYNFIDQGSYTETGAPGANLSVKNKHAESFRSGLGAKISTLAGKTEGWSFLPNLRAAWMHEFNQAAPVSVSSYAGGSSFITPGLKPTTEAGIFGIGLDAKSSDGMTLSFKYDAELREQYTGHNFMLQLRQQF